MIRFFAVLTLVLGFAAQADDQDEVAAVLDAFHKAASNADGEAYFDLMTPDAVYIGTDVTEFWSVEQFKGYAMPYFNQGRGWTYTPRSRDIRIEPDGGAAWFHEVLDSQSYGTSRGTGLLRRLPDGSWKISRYHLTFPIPNAIAKQVTDEIKAIEASKK